MATFNLKKHLKQEHSQTPISQYLREIVYGGNDGIVTTFAVVAGFAGAQQDAAASVIPTLSVLLFGLANLFADAFSMGLGSFLSLRAQQDVYKNEKAKEYKEILQEPDIEFRETVEILTRKKFSKADATQIASLYRKNRSYWTEFMMKDELELANPEKENPMYVAGSTFLAFISFGFIPLLPYLFKLRVENLFFYSCIFTASSLLLLGLLRAFVSKQKPLRGIIETLLVGGISASVAYIVGTFFRL